MTTPVVPDLSKTAPGALSILMEKTGCADELWSERDLGAILRHQLSSPMEFSLDDLSQGQFNRLEVIAQSRQLLLRSFSELLLHEQPPLELLIRMKDFAKRQDIHPDSALPKDVCGVLYFAAISAALVRHQRCITSLDRASLRRGFQWGASREWVPEPIRALLRTACERSGPEETR